MTTKRRTRRKMRTIRSSEKEEVPASDRAVSTRICSTNRLKTMSASMLFSRRSADVRKYDGP